MTKVTCNLSEGILTPVTDKDHDKLTKLGEAVFVDVEAKLIDPVRDKLLKKLWLMVTTLFKECGDLEKLKPYDDPTELVDAIKVRARQYEPGRSLDGTVYPRTMSSRDMNLQQVEHLYDTTRAELGKIIGRDPESLLPPLPGTDDGGRKDPTQKPESEYIGKLLAAAVDSKLSADEREKVINDAVGPWISGPLAGRADFAEMVRQTAVRLARGELTTPDAKKFMEAQI